MSYIRVEMSFQKRERLVEFMKYEKVANYGDDADLIVDETLTELDKPLPVQNVLDIDIYEYRYTLAMLKKKLNLNNTKQVLELLMKRDKDTLKTTLQECNLRDLRGVLAALAVYEDIMCFKKEKLVVYFLKSEFEKYGSYHAFHFFRVYNHGLNDPRIFPMPGWMFFARKVSQKLTNFARRDDDFQNELKELADEFDRKYEKSCTSLTQKMRKRS